MAAKIGTARLDSGDILSAEVCLGDTAVHLHGAHGCHKHHAIRGQPRLAALDIHELFSTEIGAKARLCHHVIGQFKGRCRRDD